ncbi:MAG: magnesium transporter [Methanobacteriota archaeon]|nr:MAG: magnesium transporter [Euryarchaeota archaeon]
MKRPLTEDPLSELVSKKEWSRLKEEIVKLHPADLARFLDGLDPDVCRRVVKMVPHETVEELLPELPEDLLIEVILAFPARKSAQLLSALPPDEMTDVLEHLPPEIRRNVFRHFSKEDTEEARNLLRYASDTAGGLMTTEVLYLREDMTVKEAMGYIKKKAKEFETIYYVYLVDREKRLTGVASLRDLVLAPSKALLKEISNPDVISVRPEMDQEEVARLIARYDFFGLPVVDDRGTLLGMVTIDDVVDVIMDEATEDITKIGGTLPLKETYLFSSPYQLVKSRIVWLLLLFVAASITSRIISGFQEMLTSFVALAFFIPLIIDTGGNTGSQASTLVIRGMATGEVKKGLLLKVLARELFVGIMLGLLVAVAGLALAYTIGVSSLVAVTVGATIVAVVFISNLLGTLLPMIIRRLGLDPAVISAPLLTTIVDALGLLIYFSMAKLLL